MPVASIILLLPFLGWVSAVPVYRRFGKWVGWWATLVALAAFGLTLSQLFSVVGEGGEAKYFAWEWMPALGVNFSLYLDGLSIFFALLISGMGVIILGYSNFYMDPRENLGRFYALMLLFMGSMLGIALSSNLIVLYVFWEFTTLSSFLLIAFWDREAESRYSAAKALYITVVGGLAMLAGFVLLYVITGTLELRDLLGQGELVRSSVFYVPAAVLILMGAFTKSAQVPFHNWLPAAMVAPTPVSAYLHSAAMVKAGIFLMARLFPVLAGTSLWFYLVGTVGLVTLVFGAYHAVRQTELKALLAYSTVSQLGLMTALLGFGSPLGVGVGTSLAVFAALFHLLNHALFKGSLFLISGVVDHAAGTRVLRNLGGLAAKMPVVALFAGVAALAMAGIPPLNGFLSKELFFDASLHLPFSTGQVSWVFPALAVGGSLLTVVYSLRLIDGIFFGRRTAAAEHAHPPSLGMLLFIAAPATLVLVVGVFTAPFLTWLVEPASQGALQASAEVVEELAGEVALWSGFTSPLGFSVIAVGLGLAAYLAFRNPLRQAAVASRTMADWLYDRVFLAFLLRGTERVYLVAQSGYLRHYITAIALFLAGLVGYTMVVKGTLSDLKAPDLGDVELFEYGLVGLLMVATLATTVARDRMWAVIALGMVGGMVVGVWVIYSAPDLALTQLLIEAISLVLFVLVFFHGLPFAQVKNSARHLVRDILVSGSVGVIVTGLMWLVIFNQQFESIRPFFLERALSEGGGRNVVNVIIVDFRGYDTMGEITVLAVAAVGLFAVHRLRKRE